MIDEELGETFYGFLDLHETTFRSNGWALEVPSPLPSVMTHPNFSGMTAALLPQIIIFKFVTDNHKDNVWKEIETPKVSSVRWQKFHNFSQVYPSFYSNTDNFDLSVLCLNTHIHANRQTDRHTSVYISSFLPSLKLLSIMSFWIYSFPLTTVMVSLTRRIYFKKTNFPYDTSYQLAIVPQTLIELDCPV